MQIGRIWQSFSIQIKAGLVIQNFAHTSILTSQNFIFLTNSLGEDGEYDSEDQSCNGDSENRMEQKVWDYNYQLRAIWAAEHFYTHPCLSGYICTLVLSFTVQTGVGIEKIIL